MRLEYFGTNLIEPNNNFFEVTGDSIYLSSSYSGKIKELGFYPELLSNKTKAGETEFLNINGFSVLVINGSPTNPNPNSKSVFFTKGNYDYPEFKKELLDHGFFREVINFMPFPVEL